MALTVNKPYVVLRTGELDEKLTLHASIGFCDGIVIDKPYIGLSASIHDNKPVYLVGNQTLEADGTLTVDKPYIGLQASSRDDKLVFLVDGKDCGDSGVSSCECDICCTLDATVQVGSDGDAYAWTDPLDVDLTCGGVILMSGGHCCVNDLIEDDFICFKITSTIAEKNTIGSPTAYVGASGSGTREAKSDIWSSGSFDIEGVTYRLSFWRIEGTVYQTLPSVVTTPFCSGGWVLQYLVTSGGQFDVYGPYWANVAGTDLSSYLSGGTVEGETPYAWAFTLTDDNPYDPDDCPEGYSYSGGDLIPEDGCDQHGGGGDPYTSGSSYTGSAEDCPVVLEAESWYRLNADPDDDAHRLKCAKISIADMC